MEIHVLRWLHQGDANLSAGKRFTIPHHSVDLEEYDFDSVPTEIEVSLMDEKWFAEFCDALRDNDSALYSIGYHTPAIVRDRGHDALEISIFLAMSRFHEIRVILPRDKFIVGLARSAYDVKPHVFVKNGWLTDLHLRHHCVFALFDVIGVRAEIRKGKLSNKKLVRLRSALDEFADQEESIALVSFADSLFFKTTFQLGQYDSDVAYSYTPEIVIAVFPRIQAIFKETLGLDVYACVTQGVNLYDDNSLLTVSERRHHVSLNSLGLPFAQLLSIDEAARARIRANAHAPCDLYMDSSYYNSLSFERGFDKSRKPKFKYENPVGRTGGYYFAEDFEAIHGALRQNKSES